MVDEVHPGQYGHRCQLRANGAALVEEERGWDSIAIQRDSLTSVNNRVPEPLRVRVFNALLIVDLRRAWCP
jgi:hypothetical protein